MVYSAGALGTGTVVEVRANINENNIMTGTIKTLTDKGFGFISREGEAKDLFFHSKELVGVTFDELKTGDTVSFEVIDTEKGPAATQVSRA
jgi:CspA family cold shock protein